MYRTGNANWPSRLFFLFTGLFFTWAVYYLSTGAIDPAYYRYLRSSAGGAPVNIDRGAADRIWLPLDAETIVGAHQLTYKGEREGSLLIDVVIPALDKRFAYHHAIPLAKARQGFNLAGREFVLIAASRKAARIRPVYAD